MTRRKSIDATQADKWRTVKLPQPLLEGTAKLGRRFGYEIAGHECA